MTRILRDVIVLDTAGEYKFNPADYPWLMEACFILKGGRAADSDQDGKDGYMIIELYADEPGE